MLAFDSNSRSGIGRPVYLPVARAVRFQISRFVISSNFAVVDRYVIITVTGSLPGSLRSQ